jgi:signal transduction histidine kinase
VDDNGLGLWLVRHLVAAHGGRLRAHAPRSRGLVMEVTLPRQRP